MPFVLNLFPLEKAKLISAVHDHSEIAPLCQVLVEKIPEEDILEEGLNLEQSVVFKFLKA